MRKIEIDEVIVKGNWDCSDREARPFIIMRMLKDEKKGDDILRLTIIRYLKKYYTYLQRVFGTRFWKDGGLSNKHFVAC